MCEKKSPPTQRYLHRPPLSGMRNTNKTNNILYFFNYGVMGFRTLTERFLLYIIRTIKYQYRIFA